MKPILKAHRIEAEQARHLGEFTWSPKYDGVHVVFYNNQALSPAGKPYRNLKLQSLAKHVKNLAQVELIAEGGKAPLNITTGVVNSFHGNVDEALLVMHGRYGARVASRTIFEDELLHGSKHIAVFHPNTISAPQFDSFDGALAFATQHKLEGVMGRKMHVAYKHGRATPTSLELVKYKFMSEGVARIIGFDYLRRNENEQTTSPTGYATRSNHQANKIDDKSLLGSLLVRNDQGTFNIGSGFSEAQRRDFLARFDEIDGLEVEYEFMPTSGYARPRQPIFKRIKGEI